MDGKPLSALPETPALRMRALDEKENAVDMRHCLYVYFLHEGIISLLPVLSSRDACHLSSSHEDDPSSWGQCGTALRLTTRGSSAYKIAASLAVIIFICHHTWYRHSHQQANQAMRHESCPSERFHVTPDPSLCNPKKTRGIIRTNRKHHTPSIGLILRSDLLGNVQGTAHITCDIVSIASQV